MVLAKMKETAEAYLGKKVTHAIVTVPAYFNHAQCHSVFKVLATTGDTHLGGKDFDNRIIDYLTELYKKKTDTDVSKKLRVMGKLKREVEKAFDVS